MSKQNYKLLLTALMMLTLLVVSGAVVSSSTAAPADVGDHVVVAFDLGHNGNHARDSDMRAEVYQQFEDWGYEVVNITGAFTEDALKDVDILITFSYSGTQDDSIINTAQFTSSELEVLKNWFNSGGKSIWVTADSDFSDPNGVVAENTNKLLEAIGSNVLVEQASVESNLNADDVYRVRPGTFNTEDEYVTRNFYRDNVDLSATGFFHGPAPLIGRQDDGTLVKLENNDAFFEQYNAYWIIAATNNNTYSSWINRGSLEGLQYQVHDLDESGSFVMMTAQKKTVSNGVSRIVVSGEAIMTLYKNMFNTTDEYGNPSVNFDLTKNTMEWLSGVEVTETTPGTTPAGGVIPGFEIIAFLFGMMAIIPVIKYSRKRE